MKKRLLSLVMFVFLTMNVAWGDGFTVERAVNLGKLSSWADISQFQWQEIDHGVQDNHEEMDALINLFYDPAPKDTVNFYNQIYSARDNQYIVLRLDKAQGKRPFYIRVTSINSSEDSSLNTSKLFTAVNYAYIMPPIGETQFMVRIWPQGEGEEMAKTYTFHGHSYGSMSLRTAMLDKSRIVPGDYDLQLIFYNSDTQISDTTYIESLQTDKLYTFYDYKDGGDLVESYLRVNRFKRIKLKPESWARDAVTHINDNSVTVMTGPKMPFNQHKRLDAPNPTYLDSRLFSHHDTLWVNLYLDNEPSDVVKGLTMHAVLADYDNNPVGDKLLTWGKDSVSNRLYVLTDGEPCTIECYRDGFLPKLCMYPGSYDHVTGIISGDREEVDIFLESIAEPVNSPRVTSAVLSTLTPSTDLRGDVYVSEIQQADILPTLLTETVKYDEFASHKDTMKIVNGEQLMSHAEMEVTIVSPTGMGAADITLKKVHNAEKNDILEETLDGDTRVIYSHLYDYRYWTTTFDLRNYLAIKTSGRPAVAFGDTEVRQLPILENHYLDIAQMQSDFEKALKERLEGQEAEEEGNRWISDVLPNGASSFSARIPLVPPFYYRCGMEMDFFKAKKISVSAAYGFGIFYDVIKGKSNKDPEMKDKKVITMGSNDMGLSNMPNISSWWNDEKQDDSQKNKILDTRFMLSAFAESFGKVSVPLSLLTFDGTSWGQWLVGFDFLEEIGVRAEANASVRVSADFLEMVAKLGNKDGKGANWTKSVSDFYNGKVGKVFKEFISPLQFYVDAGAAVNISTGMYGFNNTQGSIAPWKNHFIAFKFLGQAYANAQLKAKLDVGIASAEAGVSVGGGINFKYGAGCRIDCRNGFSGSAYSWYGGLGLYYKLKAFGWSKYGSKSLGRTNPQQKLIKPHSYKNPFDKNFIYYLSDDEDPSKAASARMMRRASSGLPGDFVTELVDFSQPVKFISGGDSIIYQGSYENPNDYCVEVASTGNSIYLSDWNLGGCTAYDAASIPGTDLVVLEQATGKIAQEDLEDSLHLGETMNRASRVYSIYYTKKNANTKWYSPKPVYSSTETTSYMPRVALANDGTGVAIWQEGLLEKGSWVQPVDTVELGDIVMNGHLMMSRFDGNETWSAPIPLMTLDENCALKDYRITYDGSTAFIVARKASKDADNMNICFTTDAAGNVTMHDVEQTDELMRLRRVGDYNVLAWKTPTDSLTGASSFCVKSYGMDGKAKTGINTSLVLNQVNVEDFRIIPDLEAKSLNNVALLWSETSAVNDSTVMRLMASRLVPNQDGSFGLGTPKTTVRVSGGNIIYDFDGYMTNEKIRVCYVAVDEQGNSQINKTTSYFGNAFNYTVQFDNSNNQGFQCDKNEITLLITVNNYGTSTISECVLTVDSIDKPFPLNMTIPSGASAMERITIPYTIGMGVNTTMRVKYDDVLGIQEQSYARYLARRQDGRRSAIRRSAEELKEDGVYEQRTATLYPYQPKLECFVVAQRVDKNGDNHITICVRNYARRQSRSDFAYIVGLKESATSPVVYIGGGEGHIQYDTKMIFNNPEDVKGDGGCMRDFGSYHAGYVTITVPNVMEKKDMFVGATLVYKDPKSGWFMELTPDYNSDSKNGTVTLYPSSEAVSVKNVYNNDDEGAHMRISRQGSNLLVTGAEPRQQVRLYQANGTIIGRRQADGNGRVAFTAPAVSGVGLVSSDKETVKFTY